MRAAIAAAAPGDTVEVPASSSHYKVTLGAIPITKAITIKGAGEASTIIDAAGASRVFHITSAAPSAGTVTFEDLTITRGSDTAQPGGGGILNDSGKLALNAVAMTANSVNLGAGEDGGGGAIYGHDNATGVTITGSSLTGNSANITDNVDQEHGGAAVFEDALGVVKITSSTISSNRVTVASANCCAGGAVFQNSDRALIVIGSRLDNNRLTQTGGAACCSGGAAIFDNGNNNATISITSSTLDGNVANVSGTGGGYGGGAVNNDSGAPLTVSQSELNSNATTVTSGTCCSGGGAISNFTAVQISGSTLNSNKATVSGADCCDGGGAVLISDPNATSQISASELSRNDSRVTKTGMLPQGCCNGGGAVNDHSGAGSLQVLSSDMSENQATGNATNHSGGGAIYTFDGGDVFTNSTFSGNSTDGSGATDGGGAVLFDQAGQTEKLSFLTIAGNSAPSAAGGGVWTAGATISTKNSIVALNTASGGSNCGSDTPAFSSAGHNLEDSPDSCGFTAGTDQVVPSASVKLGPLANNGGPTMTRALWAGRPGIAAIPLSFCTDQTPAAVTIDQRGVSRPQPTGGACDIGAYEFGDADLALAMTAKPPKVNVGQPATATLSVSDAGPAPATNTVLNLNLPSGLKIVSEKASQGSCVPGPQCSLGAISAGAAAQVKLVVRATEPGKLTAQANVSATEPDPSAANNTQTLVLNAIVPPHISRASQTHNRWREGNQLATLAGAHKPPVGTAFSFTLNEAASVKLALAQSTAHHRRVTRGALNISGHSGHNKIKFQGRISKSKKLAPGSYTLLITAKANGKKSNTAKLHFTIASA